MKRLLELAVEKTFYVNLIAITICGIGIITLSQMKRDLIPPLEWPFVRVQASLPGASPVEVESLVTYPMEEVLSGLPGLKETSSTSRSGSMEIKLEFHANQAENLPDVVQRINERIMGIRHDLPKDLQAISVRQDKVDDVYLASYAVENMDAANESHRASIIKVQRQIGAIPGVARVEVEMPDRNLFIRIKPEALQRHELHIGDVRRAVSNYFQYESLGSIRRNGKQYSVKLSKSEPNIETIRSMPIVVSRTNRRVLLSDVAVVEWDRWQQERRWLLNGAPIAELTVRKDLISDSIALHEKVVERAEQLDKTMPEPLVLSQVFDGPRFIRKQIETLTINGWLGFALVTILLSFFLGFRVALMSVIGLPIAYLGTFIVLSWFGVAIDLLSILGMILVVGILVDDAIIVAERYTTLLKMGLAPKEAASVAAKELMLPVTGTVLTTVVAFLPIILIKDNLTWFLSAIPLVVIISMTFSWLESFFILPNHLAHFVRVKDSETQLADRIMAKLEHMAGVLTAILVRFRYLVLVGVFGFIFLALYLATNHMQQHFNISIGSEQVQIYAILKNSESLDQTEKKLKSLMNYANSFPKEDVEFSSTRIGFAWVDGTRKEGYRYAQIKLNINGNNPYPIQTRNRILAQVKEDIKGMQSDEFEKLYAEERKRGEEGWRKNMVSVVIEGMDSSQFVGAEMAVRKKLSEIKGLTAVENEDSSMMDQYVFKPKHSALIEYGIDRRGLASQIKEYVTPYEIQQVRVNGESISVLTEVAGHDEKRLAELDKIKVLNGVGNAIPVTWLGTWEKQRVQKEIEHRSGMRFSFVRYKFDPEVFNMQTAREEINAAILGVKDQYSSLSIYEENANKREEQNRSWTMKVTMYSVIGVFLVLALLLGRLLEPFVVLLPAPLGMVGSLIMLWAHGQSLTLMAMIGFMGVIGVAVNDSIVLMHYVNRLRNSNAWSLDKVLVEAVKGRLRAILLTTITTLVGLFPTGYGLFGESGFTQPITFSMAWGLFFSTFMTVWVLPSLIHICEDVRILGGKIFKSTMAIPAAIPGRRFRIRIRKKSYQRPEL